MKRKTFRHQNQLAHLERTQPEVARHAIRLKRLGLTDAAIHIIRQAIHHELDRLTRPAPQIPAITTPALYDLVIAVKKYGYNTTSQADNPIAWLKFAGRAQEAGQGERLTDPAIQERLADFELVETEGGEFLVIYKYKKDAPQ